jgi:hypothetical protein
MATYTLHQDLPATNIQRRVTVNHEDLLCLGVLNTTEISGGPPFFQPDTLSTTP